MRCSPGSGRPLGGRLTVGSIPGPGRRSEITSKHRSRVPSGAGGDPIGGACSKSRVYRPVRGVIDLVFHDPIRRDRRHRDSIGTSPPRTAGAMAPCQGRRAGGWRDIGRNRGGARARRSDGHRPCRRLLVLRSTPATRHVVSTYRKLIASAYPARYEDAFRSLTGRGPMARQRTALGGGHERRRRNP